MSLRRRVKLSSSTRQLVNSSSSRRVNSAGIRETDTRKEGAPPRPALQPPSGGSRGQLIFQGRESCMPGE